VPFSLPILCSVLFRGGSLRVVGKICPDPSLHINLPGETDYPGTLWQMLIGAGEIILQDIREEVIN